MTTAVTRVSVRHTGAPSIKLQFHPRATMPERLEARASQLGITTEQLIHRFISDGMRDHRADFSPAALGTSIEEFLVQNGVLKAA